jgi:hypothetical protein
VKGLCAYTVVFSSPSVLTLGLGAATSLQSLSARASQARRLRARTRAPDIYRAGLLGSGVSVGSVGWTTPATPRHRTAAPTAAGRRRFTGSRLRTSLVGLAGVATMVTAAGG